MSAVAEEEHAVTGLPDGWTTQQLGQVARIVTGKTPSTKDDRFWNGDVPFVTPSDIGDSPWCDVVERHLSPLGASTVTTAPAGAVLFTCIASIGKSCILSTTSAFNQQINACIPGPSVDSYFLFSQLQTMCDEISHLAGTTAVPIINKSTFSAIPICLPPLDEQRRIAEVLRSVDEAIARTKVAAEQASRTIEGMLQRLFVEGIGHTAFKDGHSTLIPTTWEERPLGKLSATPITYGVVQPGDNVADGVPLVRGGDFPNGRIDLKTLRTIGNDIAEQYRRTQLSGGEVLVSLVGYPGACAVVPQKLAGANVNRAVAVIKAGDAVTANYLYHFIRSPVAQARLMKETIGSAQKVINLRDLKAIMVAVPPKREQEKIAAILTDLDAFVELETANLDKLTTLKGSIAADLLSGRVRVPA